jgi:hypothetical protein
MQNLLRVDPTPDGAAATNPLFRDVNSNQPLRTGALRRLLQSFMLAIVKCQWFSVCTHFVSVEQQLCSPLVRRQS